MSHPRTSHAFDNPATYRIRSLGTLDASWSDYFGGMTITLTVKGEGERVITLVGCLPDQAALLGVLNHLYDLGLPLLSVEQLLDERPGHENDPDGLQVGIEEPGR